MKNVFLIACFSLLLMGCNMNPSKEARIQDLEAKVEQTQEQVESLESRVIELESAQQVLQDSVSAMK